jgi:acid phosphatase
MKFLRSLPAAVIFVLLTVTFTSAQYRGPDPATTQARAAADPTFYLPTEPTPNLGLLKNRLRDYADCAAASACYARDLDAQTARASVLLEAAVAHSKPGEKLALVLDIDETSLSNLEEMEHDDFGYISQDFNAWVVTAKAPAIPGTLRLFNQALSLGVKVFFITGRDESQRVATIDNLTSAGYHGWQSLSMQPASSGAASSKPFTVAVYKSAERGKIVAAGYRIVMNVGDQLSDLDGDPHADFSIRLPNPFYYLP